MSLKRTRTPVLSVLLVGAAAVLLLGPFRSKDSPELLPTAPTSEPTEVSMTDFTSGDGERSAGRRRGTRWDASFEARFSLRSARCQRERDAGLN